MKSMDVPRKLLLPLFKTLVVILGAVLSVYLIGPNVYEVHGVSVRAAVMPALDSRTVLEIPPIGSLTANTHTGPVELRLTITGIRPEEIGNALRNEGQSELLNEVENRTQGPLIHFFLRQIAVGGFGAALLYWAVFRPPARRLLMPAVGGLVLVALALGITLQSYNRDAFREPEYHGIVAAAPRVLHLADEFFDKIQDFQDKTHLVVRNMQMLYGQVDRLDFMSQPGHRKVLVIADIHNNFVALEFINALVRHFEVDMVLDAGDITDFGSVVELQPLSQIAELGIPYVFAPGNHDSPEVIEFMRRLPNVQVLEGSMVEVLNMKILGSPDPWAYGNTVVAENPEEEIEKLQGQVDGLRSAMENGRTTPDIIMVHNPIVGRQFMGDVPMIVVGHTHQIEISQSAGSTLINPGSAGAEGFRGLQSDKEAPYTAIILHFDLGNGLVAADVIKYQALSGSFTVERRLLGNPVPETEATSPEMELRPAL